ncbi:MAG TPA: hypothetical protein VIW80_08590 [Pyrinomonadaceae bacterium]
MKLIRLNSDEDKERAARERYGPILLIFVGALLLRVLFVLWLNYAAGAQGLSVPRFANDSVKYDALARSLASGEGYQVRGDHVTVSGIAPLFPLLLAGLHLLSGGKIPIVLLVGFVNALLGALTALCLYHLVRLCFMPGGKLRAREGERDAGRVALLAAALFSVYPFEIFNTAFVLKESLSIFLTVGFALVWVCMLRAGAETRLRWAALAGAACGLSALSRFPHTGLMLMFVVVNLWLGWRRERSLVRETALALFIFALVLTPWLVRNYYVLGQVTLTFHGPSRYLYNANSDLAEPELNGYYEARGEARAEHNKAIDASTKRDVYASESVYLRHALAAFSSHPGHVLRLMGGKLVNMWRPVWAGSSLRTWMVLGVPYLLMMALALPGLALARKHPPPDSPAVIVLYALILFYVMGHTIFYSMIRERQYIEPFLIAFAGYTLSLLLKRREGIPVP